eukprot:COSAG01_NODE_29541_length_635_cov_0.875000_2_plen_172_part_01
MPFLGQKNHGKTAGGPADKAFYWLSQLGADMVRFAPWFPNERIVVAELEPPDCSRNFSSWNITLLDQIYADFARAVGNHSVAMQLSTLPSWMLTDGKPINATNPNPWEPDMNYGRQGGTFRDKSYAEVPPARAPSPPSLVPRACAAGWPLEFRRYPPVIVDRSAGRAVHRPH